MGPSCGPSSGFPWSWMRPFHRSHRRFPIRLLLPHRPPAPSPSPSPSAYLVVIADATDPTLAPVLTGATLSTLKAAQRGKIYAPTDEQLAAKGYDRAMAVKNVTAPCALLLDFRTGKVLSAFALPTTDAALAAELSKPHFR